MRRGLGSFHVPRLRVSAPIRTVVCCILLHPIPRRHGRSGEVFVLLEACLDPPNEDGRCYPYRVVVRLVGSGASSGRVKAVFDQRAVFDLPEDWSVARIGSFEFVDLDGDGDIDLLGEWSQGSANNVEIYAFHWQDGSYRIVRLWSGPMADRSVHRGPEGRLVFHFEHRLDFAVHEDAESDCPRETLDVVHWNPAMPTETELDWPFD